MGILAWIILGLLVGLVAKVILHSDDPGGVILTPSSALSERRSAGSSPPFRASAGSMTSSTARHR
jgi:hypothetical protein